MMARVIRHPRGWIECAGVIGLEDPERDRQSTALHEAAHAVAAEVTGARVRRLGLYRGRSKERRPSGWCGFCESFFPTRRGRVDVVQRGVVALAGHEAEVRFMGRPVTKLPAQDYREVLALGCSPDSANALGWLARHLVQTHERPIRRVAAALLERGELTRRQFLAARRPPRR